MVIKRSNRAINSADAVGMPGNSSSTHNPIYASVIWIAGPGLLIVGIFLLLGTAIGAGLGPVSLASTLVPFFVILVAGGLSAYAYLRYPPSNVVVRRIALWCYVVPTLLASCYALVATAYSFSERGKNGLIAIKESRNSSVPGTSGDAFVTFRYCLKNSVGERKSCDNKGYIYMHSLLPDVWVYGGGGTLEHTWIKKDADGGFTADSERMKIHFKIERGPELALQGKSVPMRHGDVFIATISSNSVVTLKRGSSALMKLDLPDFIRNQVAHCVTTGNCPF